MEVINDILGYENLKIYQNDDFFAFSLDSIVLANYATIRLRDKKIVDFCSGNGVVSLILSRRTNNKIVGVEIQKALCSLANKSIKINNLEDKIEMVNEDIKEFSRKNMCEFDLVVCNPPYFKLEEKSSTNISREKAIARHEVMINLRDVCCSASKVLKDNGTFSMVHRSDRLIEIIMEFRQNNIEPKKIKFIYEKLSKESTLVLIEGQKNGKVGLKIAKPLVLYNEDGSYTLEYEKLQKEVRL